MENTHVLFSTHNSEDTGQSQNRHSFSVHLLDAKQTYLLPSEFLGESDTSLPCLPCYRGHTLSTPCGSIEASVKRLAMEFKIHLYKIPIHKILVPQSPNILYHTYE